MSLHCTLDLFVVPGTFLEGSLLHRDTTQAGLAAGKHPEPNVCLIHIAVTPAMSICCVSAAHGEGRPLVLQVAELVWDYNYGVLHRTGVFKTEKQTYYGMYQYVLLVVRTRMNKVCTCMYFNCNVCLPVD